MIGVQMGIDGLNQLEIKFVHELEVTVDFLQYGIDDQRLAPAPARKEVGVGARDAVKELAEDHRLASPIWGLRIPLGRSGQYKYSMPF